MNSSVTLTWSLHPLQGENADWLTVHYSQDDNKPITTIWKDISGVTGFGSQIFNDTLTVTYVKNKKMEVIIEGIQSSMNIYVTAIFIDEKGTIKGGPVYSKFNLTMSKGMYVVHV